MKKVKALFRFKWEPTRDTWLALGAGLVVILLSYSLNLIQSESLWSKILTFLILTLGIRIGIGFFFPLQHEMVKNHEGWAFFGVTKRRWILSLILNLVFAALLLLMFLSESGESGEKILLNKETLISIYYILIAGVFEMVFIYGFLRKTFEQAFGLIPSLILTALFYSFYHAGFQPEFSKLIFVGLLYGATFRLTENVLIVFPFFWGVGAAWDVLVNFGATELSGVWVLGEAIIATILMAGIVIWIIRKRKANLQSQN
jgi:membrane protease YdiL (CAAX protease family)